MDDVNPKVRKEVYRQEDFIMENNKNFGNAPLTLVKSPRDGRDWKYGEPTQLQ